MLFRGKPGSRGEPCLGVGFEILATTISLLLTAMLLAGCGGSSGGAGSGADSSSEQIGAASLSPVAKLGEKIFKDRSLSASGKLACATCHNPDNAHAPANDLAVQMGGPDLMTPGFRAAPSLRYLDLTPAFSIAKDGKVTGGFDRDGRAQSLAVQAARPLLAPHEMANASTGDVVNRLKQTSYAKEFSQVFGSSALDNPDTALDRMTFALQQYQKEDPDFHPYDSKYDQFLAGKAKLSSAELRGLALFNNPNQGNCAACHTSKKGADGSAPLFTDFTFDNIGVPRNPDIPATADATYFDLGLCGPDRTDLTERTNLCGAFKVPSLRNVATRRVFFHNGRFKNLRDALGFYVRRDTNPEEWYPVAADGTVMKFNDLPDRYKANVNTTEVPYNRTRGMAPALSAPEIDDVIQFLGTLTDGYQ